jgi:hypothetical protein
MKKASGSFRLQRVMSHKPDVITEYRTKSGQLKNRKRYTVLPTVVKLIKHKK